MIWCRLLFFIAAGAFGVAWPGVASRADPLRSPAYLDALDALHAREAMVVPARVPDPALLALRRRAAAVCLGMRDEGPTVPGRSAQAPLSTANPPLAPPPPVAAVVLSPLLSTPPRPLVVPAPPPLTTLNCDAVGCTASDGSRLNRMGTNLWGPGGACIALGPVLQCP